MPLRYSPPKRYMRSFSCTIRALHFGWKRFWISCHFSLVGAYCSQLPTVVGSLVNPPHTIIELFTTALAWPYRGVDISIPYAVIFEDGSNFVAEFDPLQLFVTPQEAPPMNTAFSLNIIAVADFKCGRQRVILSLGSLFVGENV